MWWSAFSWDKKGPYYIWEKETKEEKVAMKADIDACNAIRYEADKLIWETEWDAKVRYIQSHVRPAFKHTEKTGLIEVKKGRGGINWYRYQQKILIPKLLPFAVECKRERPGTQVQEDNAPAHASKQQELVFSAWDIMKLLWPGNSPDLNAIEPCWFWMKRKTTEKGAITSEKALKAAWVKCWEELPQDNIQCWIERVFRHVQEVKRLKGGNEYKEGRYKGEEQLRVYA